jgi:hypothetical protein
MISGVKGPQSTCAYYFRNQVFATTVGVDSVPEGTHGLVNGIQNL